MTDVFVHPSALVETSQIGAGTRVWAFAHILRDVRIGPDCNIADHVFIENGVEIGRGVTVKNHAVLWRGVRVEDFAFLGPGVVFTNDLRPRSPRMPEAQNRYAAESHWRVATVVEQGASVGANATILAGVRLGRFCMVGAGSVVTRDIPAFALASGNPARVRGYVDRMGRRLTPSGAGWVEPESGTRYVLRDNELVEQP
jgi:acetyltransferase-like isoleucine patch superfamily enzyme